MGALALNMSAAQDEEIRSLRELNDFLEKPHSIGIERLKECLRNTVQLMLELKGLSTGLTIQHLMDGSHDSMAAEDSPEVLKKKKKRKQMQDALDAFAREMSRSFPKYAAYVAEQIVEIKEAIDLEIAKIDASIKNTSDDILQAASLRANHQRRNLLEQFRARFKKHHETLQDAVRNEDPLNVMEVEKNIQADLEKLNNNHPIPTTNPWPETQSVFTQVVQKFTPSRVMEPEAPIASAHAIKTTYADSSSEDKESGETTQDNPSPSET